MRERVLMGKLLRLRPTRAVLWFLLGADIAVTGIRSAMLLGLLSVALFPLFSGAFILLGAVALFRAADFGRWILIVMSMYVAVTALIAAADMWRLDTQASFSPVITVGTAMVVMSLGVSSTFLLWRLPRRG